MMISKGERQAYPELRGDIKSMRYPAYVEPKIDGELDWYKTSIIPDNIEESYGHGYLINKSGKTRSNCPVVIELDNMKLPYHLLGELHWGEGKSGDLYEFLKHQDDDELRFTVFDVEMPGTYEERRAWLEKNITNTKHVSLVPSDPIIDKAEVERAYHYTTASGYEGIVVKSADSRLIMGPCPWVKVKKREESHCIITEIDPIRERIEVVLLPTDALKLIISNGDKRIGVKVPDKVKATLKVGDMVEIEHQGVLSRGGLRHPVYIRRIELRNYGYMN